MVNVEKPKRFLRRLFQAACKTLQSKGRRARFTFGGSVNLNAAWTPDGKWIAVQSNREGPPNIFWQRADGSWLNEQDRWMEGDANIVTGYALMALSYCQPWK